VRFTHASSEPGWTFDPTRTYEQHSPGSRKWTLKPNGLWLSVNGDWERWREEEHYGVGTPVVASFRVDFSRLRVVTDDEQWVGFCNEVPWLDVSGLEVPDWSWIATQYAGIVIAPYLHRYRFESWYYPWDCASACVWDLSAISVHRYMRDQVVKPVQGQYTA
jgi:hypothetical protein